MANKAYKYRIYPNKEQQEFFNNAFGCARFIYNNLLADRIDYYNKNKKTLKREVTYYKNQECYSFLKETDSLALDNAKKNLDTAYKNFFSRKSKFPSFHKKGVNDSYTTNNQKGNIHIKGNYIKLPKIGHIKIKQHRPIKDGEIIKSCTISKKANKYYISICVEYEDNVKPVSKDFSIDNVLGLDYSSTYFYIDSNNKKANYPRYYRNTQKKLRRAQRKLSKMVKGSQNYKKQQIIVQRIHTKISNQRLDFMHKLSNEITNRYDLICFEDLNLRSISRCLRLGKSTLDNGFGMFRSFVEYKAKDKGKYTQKIDKFYPSTKKCNNCGFVNKNITLGIKEWDCPSCGQHNDRDYNAAKNIKEEGYRLFLLQ